MLENAQLGDLSEAEVLDRATACAETARRAEVELLRIAYQWAVIHDPDRLDPVESAKPGREKARHFGGQGTAPVAEFAAATLGARIGRTTYAAGRLIADAQDLHHRHPALWGRVQAGQVRASYARHVTAKTRDLSASQAAYVDAEVAPYADGRIPWSRFEELLDGKVVAAAPQVAREREEKARKARFAKRLHGQAHGMASFMIRADIATIEQIDATITSLADKLTGLLPDDPYEAGTDEVTMSADDRRVRAALLLMHPGAALDTDLADLLPHVTIHVHAYACDDTEKDPDPDPDPDPDADADADPDAECEAECDDHVVRIEGHGAVTQSWVRRVLGRNARFTIRPVIDLAAQAPVDCYEIPERHRRAVRLMTPADCFPFASSLSPKMQIDHTTPHAARGPSAIGNYGPMTTTHHRIKTHGHWVAKQPFPGVYVWRDPHGALYLVDHTGTRRVDVGAAA
ncbi:hypothetical protein BH11ACT8_BH11ACT8_02390 [soil metagenome]